MDQNQKEGYASEKVESGVNKGAGSGKNHKKRKPDDYKMSSRFNQIVYALMGIIFIVLVVLVFVLKSKVYFVAAMLFVFYIVSLFLMKNITEFRAAKYFLKGIDMEDKGDGYSSGERVINIFQPKVTEMKEESKYSTGFLLVAILAIVIGGYFLLTYLTSVDFFI